VTDYCFDSMMLLRKQKGDSISNLTMWGISEQLSSFFLSNYRQTDCMLQEYYGSIWRSLRSALSSKSSESQSKFTVGDATLTMDNGPMPMVIVFVGIMLHARLTSEYRTVELEKTHQNRKQYRAGLGLSLFLSEVIDLSVPRWAPPLIKKDFLKFDICHHHHLYKLEQ